MPLHSKIQPFSVFHQKSYILDFKWLFFIFLFFNSCHPFTLSTCPRRQKTGRKNNYQLKEASVADASATPPTIGTREATTHGVGICNKIKQATNLIYSKLNVQETYVFFFTSGNAWHTCVNWRELSEIQQYDVVFFHLSKEHNRKDNWEEGFHCFDRVSERHGHLSKTYISEKVS